MEISKEGLELIKSFEGLRLEPYRCQANRWTIGYGHTHNVKPTDLITEIKANEYLKEDIAETEKVVNDSVNVKLAQCQFDALCSFTFNVGARAFKKSTLLRKINAGRPDDEIVAEFRKWDKYTAIRIINGERKEIKLSSEGLARRRKAEAELWLNFIFDDK